MHKEETLLLQGKQSRVFAAKDKIGVFKGNLKLWKMCFGLRELDVLAMLKDVSDNEGKDIFNKCDFLVLDDEICEHLERLHN